MSFRVVRCASNMVISYFDYRYLKPSPHGFPYTADIEPTNRCNFRCGMCQTSVWNRPRGDMTFDQFRYILDSIPTLLTMQLVGMGEPLLNSDFFKMVDLAKRRHISVKTTTNGSLLDAERRKELLKSSLRHVDISLDGATAETYEKLRPGSCFEKTIENITQLMVERGSAQTPHIRVWCVAQQENLEELPKLVELCHKMKVDNVGIQWLLNNFGITEFEDKSISARRYSRKSDILSSWHRGCCARS